MSEITLETEQAVLERYASASAKKEEALCCAVDYDPKYLEVIPDEILERDYGCGDPSQYVAEGDVVLDLGSGGGKICYIASQVVGPAGTVIGIDFNPPMIALAEHYQADIARAIGWDNVDFRFGRIQDLKTDYRKLDAYLRENPVRDWETLRQFERYRDRLVATAPLVATGSIDVIVSNCVLNLVDMDDRRMLFDEMFRTLATDGRAASSDIVADREVPEALRRDPELWSGCLSGAFEEQAFLVAFADAGFRNIRIDKRDDAPWKVIDGIEFRSVTVLAEKPDGGAGEVPVYGESRPAAAGRCC